MNIRAVKACVHLNRIADDVAALLSAGFKDVRQTAKFATPLGTISLYSAKKPNAF